MSASFCQKASFMSTRKIEVFHAERMLVGESPLWHAGEQALYWIDISAQKIHRRLVNAGSHTTWSLPSEPGCIAHHASGGLVVAMRQGIGSLDTASGKLDMLVDAPYDTATTRFNDGRCDAVGRLWVGTMYEPRDQPLGSLFSFERGKLVDHSLAVTVSNGLAFDSGRQSLYHADTTAHRIMRYEIDPADAKPMHGQVFRQFSNNRNQDYGGRPDGAAVDEEGAYWVAMFEGSRIIRLSPEGETIEELPLPVRCPTMVAFGGDDMRTLYITSASQKRSEAEIAAHPLSGCVFQVKVEARGLPEPAYLP
jgi:sugar lactone lactonase YvrE